MSERILVDAKALRELLVTLNGPEHHMRELQATRGPLFAKSNPISILIADYNAAIALAKAAQESSEVHNPHDPVRALQSARLLKLMHSYNPDLPMAPGMKAQFLTIMKDMENGRR